MDNHPSDPEIGSGTTMIMMTVSELAKKLILCVPFHLWISLQNSAQLLDDFLMLDKFPALGLNMKYIFIHITNRPCSDVASGTSHDTLT